MNDLLQNCFEECNHLSIPISYIISANGLLFNTLAINADILTISIYNRCWFCSESLIKITENISYPSFFPVNDNNNAMPWKPVPHYVLAFGEGNLPITCGSPRGNPEMPSFEEAAEETVMSVSIGSQWHKHCSFWCYWTPSFYLKSCLTEQCCINDYIDTIYRIISDVKRIQYMVIHPWLPNYVSWWW